MKKKKLIFICIRLPYPPIGGDRVKNYHLLEKLRVIYDVTLVVISSEKLDVDKKSYLSRFNNFHYFYKNKFDFFYSGLNSILKLSTPLQVGLYYFHDVQSKVDELVNSHDLVLCNLIRTSSYFSGKIIPKYCDMADSIGQNYQRSYKTVHSKLMSVYYRLEYPRLIKYERLIIDTFNKTFLYNPEEIKRFNSPEKLVYIPHGVNGELFSYPEQAKIDNTLVFLGKMDYQPNIDAVLWFINNVFKKLPNKFKLYIVGAKPSDAIIELSSARIKVTGYVDDPYEIIQKCQISIVPMVSGGGIQNKLLESMALGMPCVVSPLAALPMGNITNMKEIAIASTIDEWVSIIKSLNNKNDLRNFIGTNARDYIRKYHSWDVSIDAYKKHLNASI